MTSPSDAEIVERASQLAAEQCLAVRTLAAAFLDTPTAETYAELSRGVSRLDVAVRVQALVNAFKLEASPAAVLDGWKGGGGGFSGGGASGGW